MESNPILLVHGFFVGMRVFDKMFAYLTSLGKQVHRFNLATEYGNLGLEKLAEQISEYADKNFDRSQKFDLVGLSMGGLVSRYYVQKLGGGDRVNKFISISSPHKGTLMAYLLPVNSCVQMRPDSNFLADLNRDLEGLNKIDYTCLWTPYDFIIIPAESSLLGVGKEIKLPVFSHRMMVRDDRTLDAIAQILNV